MKNFGFTLIELLLSVTIIGMLSGLSIPVYRSLEIRNNIDIGVTSIAQSVHRAQVLSQSVAEDSQWGVKVQSGTIVLFKGITYATRDTTYDEVFELPSNINLSGQTEFVFSKVEGIPTPTGSLTLSSEGDSRTITINAYGMVDY